MESKLLDVIRGMISPHSKTMIKYDNVPMNIKTFVDSFKADIINRAEVAPQFYPKYTNDKDQQTYLVKLTSQVRHELETKKRNKASTNFTGLPDTLDMPAYIIVSCHETAKDVLINPNTLQVSKMNPEVWLNTMDEEIKKEIKRNRKPALLSYDPYDVSTLVVTPFEDREIVKVNLYYPPPWRLKKDPRKGCPPAIKKLLYHLFPIDEERNFVLDWLYNMLVSRNETYLVLNGAKGVGKGIFSTLCKALVGRDHYAEAPESFLDSQFNSVLDKKRLIALDEFKVNKDRHIKLKRYINKFQNIEKKGVDARESTETHNSFLIMNNDESDMYLEYDDRRFSVPELTKERLEEALTEEEITELVHQLEDMESETVTQFGYFIYNRGCRKYDPFHALKTEKFYRLVYTSLAIWQKFIVDFLLGYTKDKVELTRLKKLAARGDDGKEIRIPQVSKVSDFLNNYLHRGDTQLGHLVREGSDDVIIITKQYTIVDEKEEEIEEEVENGEEVDGSELL